MATAQRPTDDAHQLHQPTHDRPPDRTPALGTTRRRGFGTALRLTTVPLGAALAALPLGTAGADDGNDWARGGPGPGPAGGERRNDIQNGPGGTGPAGRADGAAAGSPLCRVADVPDADFDKGSAGSDALTGGLLSVARASGDAVGRVVVTLDGAATSTTYDVYFARFKDRGRELVGQVSTNSDGDCRAEVKSSGSTTRLSGNRRLGLFVLTRDSKDQFVTDFPTQT